MSAGLKTPLDILNAHTLEHNIGIQVTTYDNFYTKGEFFKTIIAEGNVFIAMGEGRTRKSAIQRAAEQALEVYGIEDRFEEQFKPDTRPRSHNVLGVEQPFPLVLDSPKRSTPTAMPPAPKKERVPAEKCKKCNIRNAFRDDMCYYCIKHNGESDKRREAMITMGWIPDDDGANNMV